MLVAVLGNFASAKAATSSLPFQATGALGVLDTSTARHTVVFDTSAGTESLDGVAQNDRAHRRGVEILANSGGFSHPAMRLWAFDFQSLHLGPATRIVVRGSGPLVLLSKGKTVLGAPLALNGTAGAPGGLGAGGGGGGGGGAVAVFAQGPLSFTSKISVNGGQGGVGNSARSPAGAHPSDPFHGGGGGAGAVTLASAQRITFSGEVDALSGGLATAPPGKLVLAGPVAFGRKATFNGSTPSASPRGLAQTSGLTREGFVLFGGAGGGGAGGSGLPEKRPAGYARSHSPGGAAGLGGGAGGAGGYAIAGGGGGGGGGAYSGTGGCGGTGNAGGAGGANGAPGSCSTAAAGGGGGNGGASPLIAPLNGGNGGNGGNTVGGTGANGQNTLTGAGGGGGGGGGDGCGQTAPGPGGAGGLGGIGGAQPGNPGAAQGVPTLSEIGMLTLAAMLIGLGVVRLRRRSATDPA
jgi:hypothetical protein